MEIVGKNIETLQKLINTPMVPPPAGAGKWQRMAEHVLHLAFEATNSGNLDRLSELDGEAIKLIQEREKRLK